GRATDVPMLFTHLHPSCACAEAGLNGGMQTKDPAGRSNWTVLPGENGRLWAKFTVEPGVQAVDIRYHLAVGSARPELHTRTLRYTGTEGLSFYRQGERVRELLITDLEGGERRKVDLELQVAPWVEVENLSALGKGSVVVGHVRRTGERIWNLNLIFAASDSGWSRGSIAL